MRVIHTKKSYFLFVLLPSLFLSIVCTLLLSLSETNNKLEETRISVENFINDISKIILETETSLETISTVLSTLSEEDIYPTLAALYKENEYILGYHISNLEGNVIYSTNEKTEVNISHRNYFKSVLKEDKTIVSERLRSIWSNDYINVIITPIFNEEKTYDKLLFTTFNFEDMLRQQDLVKHQEEIMIMNNNKKMIYGNEEWINTPPSNSLSLTFNEWTVIFPKPELSFEAFIKYLFISLLIFLAVFHSFYYYFVSATLKKDQIRNNAEFAKRKLDMLGNFAATTAHEIKNPLTSIQGLISLLKESHSSSEERFYYEVIEKELSQINEIASQFLMLGKPLAYNVKPFSLLKTVEQEIEKAGFFTGKENIEIVLNQCLLSNIQILGCDEHIGKCVQILLQNAIEASHPHGLIHVFLFQTTKKEVKIIITDYGVGITEEHLPNIFTPFFTTKDDSAGLNLVICKKIVESFNGTIEVDSKKDEGSTFSITLPV